MKITREEIYDNNLTTAMWIKRWRDYSLSFHIEALQAEKFDRYPTKQQKELCDLIDRNRFVLVQGGRGVGKTSFEAGEILRHMLCYRIPGMACKAIVMGPSGGQMEMVSWSEISSAMNRLLPWLRSQLTLNKELMYCNDSPGDWFATFRTAKKENTGSIQGVHGSTLSVYDDGSRIEDAIYDVSLHGMTESTARAMISFNPDKTNCYVHKMANSEKNRWAKIILSSLDCLETNVYEYDYYNPYGELEVIRKRGIVTNQFLEDSLNEMGEGTPLYKAYVLGQFASCDVNSLVKQEWVDRAFIAPRVDHIDKPVIMGVDVGYEVDPSFIVSRWGCNIMSAISHQGLAPHELERQIIEQFHSLKAAGKEPKWICIDAIGNGASIAPMLFEKGYPAVAIKVNEATPHGGVQCRRDRDRYWWKIRSFFRDSSPCFWDKTEDMKSVAEDLVLLSYKYDNGKVVVTDKKTLKSTHGKSPDGGDALMLTMAMDVDLIIKPDAPKIDKYRLLARKKRGISSQGGDSWRTI